MALDLFMVFDVESVGLHGEGYDVGYVVVDRSGKLLAEARYDCDPHVARGDDAGREWLRANASVRPYGQTTNDTTRGVRKAFWDDWSFWKPQGAVLVADCAWPVEARFLAACVDDHPAANTWGGPYPLHDLASIRLAVGLDPLGTNDRLPNELPTHDPLADARQSARLLIEALSRITHAG